MSNRASTVVVTITAAIDRDYARRGVFPELRVAKATETTHGGASGVFEISPERAQEVLADAERERLVRPAPHGMPQAYTALARQLRRNEPTEVERRGREAEQRRQQAQRDETAAALRKAAELDAAARAEETRLREHLVNEEDFRAVAHEFFWRAWTGFELVFCRRDGLQFQRSGYRFSDAAAEVLRGYVTSICWAIDADIDVVFDEDVRLATLRKLRQEATKADAPLQRFIAAVARAAT